MNEQQLKAKKRLATALMVGTALTTTVIATNTYAADGTSNNERQEVQQQTLTILLKMPDGTVNQLQFAGAPGSTVQTRKQLESLFGHNPGGKYLLADGDEYQRLPTAVLIPQNGGQIEWQLVNRNLSQKIENRPVKLVIEHRDEDGNKVLEDQVIDFTIDVKYDLDLWKNHALDTAFTVHGPQDIEPAQVPGYLLLEPRRLFTDPTSLIQDETDRNKFFIFNQEPLVMKKTALYRSIDSSKDQPNQPGSDNDDKQDESGVDEKPTTPPETDQPTGGQDEKPQLPDENPDDGNKDDSERPTEPDSGDEEQGESGKEEQPTTPERPDDKEDDAQKPDQTPDDEGDNDNPDDTPDSGHSQPTPEEPADKPDDEGGQPEPPVPDEGQNEPDHQPEDQEPTDQPEQPGDHDESSIPDDQPAEQPDAGHQADDDLNIPDHSQDHSDQEKPSTGESEKGQGGQDNGEQPAGNSSEDQPTEKEPSTSETKLNGDRKQNFTAENNEKGEQLKAETDKLTQLDQQSIPGSADDKLPQTGNNNQRSFWAAIGGLLTGFLGLGTAMLTKRRN